MRLQTLTIAVAVALFPLSSCSKDPVERAYQSCLSKMKSEIGDKMRAEQAGKADPTGLSGAATAMAEGMGKSICESMKSACEQDPNGQICRAAIAQFP